VHQRLLDERQGWVAIVDPGNQILVDEDDTAGRITFNVEWKPDSTIW
jgi:hypothetical protein